MILPGSPSKTRVQSPPGKAARGKPVTTFGGSLDGYFLPRSLAFPRVGDPGLERSGQNPRLALFRGDGARRTYRFPPETILSAMPPRPSALQRQRWVGSHAFLSTKISMDRGISVESRRSSFSSFDKVLSGRDLLPCHPN